MKNIGKTLKRIAALGASVALVGATVMGAAAVKLSDYPKPFVVNGVPASNLAVIVGDSAAASDVVGMGDIIAGLQQAAKISTPVAGAGGPRVKLLGDSVEVGTPTDLLELNETIGDVRETLTEFDLNILKGGSITTQRGVTKYNQYINFNQTSAYRSNRVTFTEDEFDNVGHFFHVFDSDEIFNWILEFEEGFISDITTQKLRDLEDRDINILGTEYAIVGTKFTNNTNETRITLLGGPIFDSLGEGDKKTYTLNDKTYEVEVVIISESADGGNGEVLLKVNGQTLPRMRGQEAEPTADGALVGIRDIIATGKDTQSSVVRFYLGAQKLEFRDTNAADNVYTPAGTTINNELIEDSDVKIRLTVNSAQDKATIQDITYSLKADALVGDLFVPAGHGVREYLDEPEGMISSTWDIRYEGLLDTGVTTLKFHPIGRDEYKLEFTNQEGLNYVVPLLTTRQSGSLRYGDFTSSRARNLVFMEPNITVPSAPPDLRQGNIHVQDYFVLSDIAHAQNLRLGGEANNVLGAPTFATGQSDNTAFSRILKFESVDGTNSVATFTDLATGTKQVTFGSDGTANLVVGGISYAIRINRTTNVMTADLNGDGQIGAGLGPTFMNKNRTGNQTAVLATEGGALIVLGQENPFDDTSASGGPPVIGAAPTVTNGGVNGFTANLSIITLAKQFDEASADQTVKIVFENRTSNRIGLITSQIVSNDQFLSLTFLTSEPEIAQGMDIYGSFYELFDPLTSDTPEELTIEYPLSQRGIQMFVTAGQVQAETVGGAVTEKVVPIPVGVGKLASEVSDATMYNAIVVGGPCANSVAAKLMGNPEPCHESVPANKAIIKLYEHANGNVALLVAGESALNTRQGSRALLTGDIVKIDAKEATVTGTTVTDITVKAV
ncbi:hypothetical protein HY486_04835 [Candidatus Woesearchaeota archaeon]|nr:hypothetical protein [Candidatus Woesearchaeota archaeon]